MKCPSCAADLAPCRYEGLILPRCERCAGTWFAPGMLKACALAMIKAGNIPNQELDIGKKVLSPHELQSPQLTCPQCARVMSKRNYGYDSNVILDQCPKCEGLWADDKKVRAVAVYTKGNPQLDRLGEAFAAESGKLQGDSDALAFLFMVFNPLSWRLLLPYRTNVPVVLKPIAVVLLMSLNIGAYLFEPVGAANWMGFLRQYGLVPVLAFGGHNFHAFITSMFLHAGLLHLAGNMYFLWLFGRNTESSLGHFDFLVLYLVSGLSAGSLQTLLAPSSAIPMIGASGAISGVLGAYMRLHPKSKVEVWMGRKESRILSARLYLGAWFALQAVSLLKNSALGFSSGVAFAAHIGGFVAGYFLTPIDENKTAQVEPQPA